MEEIAHMLKPFTFISEADILYGMRGKALSLDYLSLPGNYQTGFSDVF